MPLPDRSPHAVERAALAAEDSAAPALPRGAGGDGQVQPLMSIVRERIGSFDAEPDRAALFVTADRAARPAGEVSAGGRERPAVQFLQQARAAERAATPPVPRPARVGPGASFAHGGRAAPGSLSQRALRGAIFDLCPTNLNKELA